MLRGEVGDIGEEAETLSDFLINLSLNFKDALHSPLFTSSHSSPSVFFLSFLLLPSSYTYTPTSSPTLLQPILQPLGPRHARHLRAGERREAPAADARVALSLEGATAVVVPHGARLPQPRTPLHHPVLTGNASTRFLVPTISCVMTWTAICRTCWAIHVLFSVAIR